MKEDGKVGRRVLLGAGHKEQTGTKIKTIRRIFRRQTAQEW